MLETESGQKMPRDPEGEARHQRNLQAMKARRNVQVVLLILIFVLAMFPFVLVRVMSVPNF
ncbi:hypothetical protein [Deinococcus cellulosilyticus]|uniref:Uncharacterized protein n=1 Tax=Deinococcus cellulosilyticus (strain DSM 18568 / NBRC 106333 / KACC 11606 / 5516J-15) TaxID=1223518 RepID=A0A511N9V5_DEIC1|nr:hypothetical protein [Deinococcus cellulosilyticus]GEM49619.1 hypothetical protein DC3_52540 [Deinococcus cellulosilyticus NBRC 106333 = KACC 11606]